MKGYMICKYHFSRREIHDSLNKWLRETEKNEEMKFKKKIESV